MSLRLRRAKQQKIRVDQRRDYDQMFSHFRHGGSYLVHSIPLDCDAIRTNNDFLGRSEKANGTSSKSVLCICDSSKK